MLVPVSDVKRACVFYAELVGLAPERVSYDFATLKAGPPNLWLHREGDGAVERSGVELWIGVDDVDEVQQRFVHAVSRTSARHTTSPIAAFGRNQRGSADAVCVRSWGGRRLREGAPSSPQVGAGPAKPALCPRWWMPQKQTTIWPGTLFIGYAVWRGG